MAQQPPGGPVLTSGHYTFGDNSIASRRLEYLSDLLRPSLAAFVTQWAPNRPRHVIDLGCGPGHTTRALAALLLPEHITGIDTSERYLEEARRASPPGFQFERHDVTQPRAEDPGRPHPDVLYARLLLTHLPDPSAALANWAGYVDKGGRLLIQETASMLTAHPSLTRYYELVQEFLRRHGRRLEIGRSLAELVDATRYRILHSGERAVTLPGPSLARLYRMNLTTWRQDPLAAALDLEGLDNLDAELLRLSESSATSSHAQYVLGELVLESLCAPA